MRRVAQPARGAATAGLRGIVLLAALLAFVWQSYVVHAHIHLHYTLASGYAPSQAAPGLLADDTPPTTPPTNCAICQEISHSGVFLLPDAVSITAHSATAMLAPLVAALGAAAVSRSHAWHSRAPPLLLQA